MADEKVTPTPKVLGAPADTMHSTPDVPDRSRGEGADAPASTKAKAAETAPPANRGSVGSEVPRQRIIKSENAGTLVEDIPSNDEGEAVETNVPNPAPEGPVGLQPGEELDTRKSRGSGKAAKSKAAKSKASEGKS